MGATRPRASHSVRTVLTLGLLAGVLAAPGPGSTAPGSVSAPATPRFDAVVIDAGHGGEDEGARGHRGLAEKELVLDVSRRLARRLRERGLRVVLTRERDEFVPLETRTAVANDARADLFVSIHANAAESPRPRGIETYFVSLEASDAAARRLAERENQAFARDGSPPASGGDPLLALLGDMMATEHMRESSEFARGAQQELARVQAGRSRGVKQAPFVVLMGVQMPATLVEIGFLTNPDEERALRSASHRERIAEALTRAIVAFGERYDRRRGVPVLGSAGSGR